MTKNKITYSELNDIQKLCKISTKINKETYKLLSKIKLKSKPKTIDDTILKKRKNSDKYFLHY